MSTQDDTRTVLITGGASQTGLALSTLLAFNPKYKVVFASRSGRGVPEGFRSVKMDWYDASTFSTPFAPVDNLKSTSIDYVYLVPPAGDANPDRAVNPFIDLCIERGVKKVVLVAGSTAAIDRPLEEVPMKGLARVHRYLDEKRREGRLKEYFVVQPTWFIENFDRFFGYGIRTRDEVVTCVPTGRVPFVSVEDIAQVAYESIVNGDGEENEKIVIGPELLSYREAVEVLSQVIGRTITHRAVSKEEQVDLYTAVGLPLDYAQSLVEIHGKAEGGSEERWWKEKETSRVWVGRVTLREWAEKHVGLLTKEE